MKLSFLPRLALLCAVSLIGPLSAQDAPPPPAAKARLGINLSGINDYATELPFVDLFRSARSWISQKEGAPWGKGPTLPRDEHGWVTSLPEGGFAETLLAVDINGRYPAGQYTILYDGKGKLVPGRDAKLVSEEPGRMIVEVTPASGISLQIRETDPENYIRNIRMIMPGFESTYEKQIFHPIFLARWQGMAALRFMDWMKTNNSPQKTWAERPKMTDASWAAKGAPLELMIDLANWLKIDPWFCMPHLADDDYVRQFATMVKEKLDPSLKPHVELSNEVWNSMFGQTQFAQKKAGELGLGDPKKPWEGGAYFHAQRSVEVFRIWEEVFGGRDRLVRIIAWQAGSGADWTDSRLLAKTGGAKDVDVLAIAPYISFNVPGKSDKPDAKTAEVVAGWSLDQVLDYVENESLPKSIEEIKRHKAVADKYGVRLMCYEAGQHLVGVQGGENNSALTKLFIEANAHPRMGAVYRKYFDAWKKAGGDTMAHFSSVGRPGKWGSWGAVAYYDQRFDEAPKYKAILDAAKAFGQSVNFDPWAAGAPAAKR